MMKKIRDGEKGGIHEKNHQYDVMLGRSMAWLSAFALGLLFSFMTWVTGSVWMAVGFHWLYNWMEVAFFGIEGEKYSVFTTAVVNTNDWNLLPAVLAVGCLGMGAAIFLIHRKVRL